MLMMVGKSLTTRSDDVATTAWVSAVVAAGGSVSDARRTLVNSLIVGLKANSLWTKLDRLWLFAMENQTEALIDLVATEMATNTGTLTFTADQGFTGAVGKVIDTSFNPSIGTPKYLQDSASLAAWSLTSAQVEGGIAGFNTSAASYLFPRLTSDPDKFYWRVNQASDNIVASTDGSGFWHVVRVGATSAIAYRNGAQVDTNPAVSVAVPNATFRFASALGNTYTDGQVACGVIGESFNASEANSLYNLLHTYMTAIGVP